MVLKSSNSSSGCGGASSRGCLDLLSIFHQDGCTRIPCKEILRVRGVPIYLGTISDVAALQPGLTIVCLDERPQDLAGEVIQLNPLVN